MPTEADRDMMRAALAEARLAAEEGEMPVGCVITRRGTIIARAHNDREAGKDPTAHAEILAIRRAAAALGDWRLTDTILYVTLEPCPMCAGAIAMARIARLYYGAADPSCGCTGSVYRLTEDPAFPHYCPADGGLLAADCAALLQAFFQRRRAEAVAKGGCAAKPCF